MKKTMLALMLFAACAPASEADIYEALAPSVFHLTSGMTQGTGFVVAAPSGRHVMITNWHVCDHGELQAFQDGGGPFPLTTLVKDPSVDLCVLSNDSLDSFEAVSTESVYTAKYERLYTVGHPHGGQLTPSAGHIYAEVDVEIPISRDFPCPGFSVLSAVGCLESIHLFDTTIPVQPGDSGSPVVNAHLVLVGIAESTKGENEGAIVPVSALRPLLRGL